MRITAREHPEAIKRYRHVRPARAWRVEICAARCPGDPVKCTLERGHRGPHVAHDRLRRVVAVWDARAARPRASAAKREAAEAKTSLDRRPRKPIGLRQRPDDRLVHVVRTLASRALSSWDQIAFLVLFIVFVKLAIDVLRTLH